MRRPSSPAAAAFTLMEVMMASVITALLISCLLFSVIALQHSYAATEQFGARQADQARLLDYLALDLRRAVSPDGVSAPYTLDADGQGLKLTTPDYYQFAANDPQHLCPLPVTPKCDPSAGAVSYNGSGAPLALGETPHQMIVYRFDPADGSVTRSDPWQPLVPDGVGGYTAAPPVVVANNMKAFPILTADAADISGNTVHYQVTFYSPYRPLAAASDTAEITLSNVTFIRGKNLSH